jgi:PKD domain
MQTHLLRTLTIAALAAGALLVPATANAAPPANDDFANATVIDPSSLPISEDVSTAEATAEGFESSNVACLPAEKTVWYSITTSTTGVLRADAAASSFSDTIVRIYKQTGSDPSGLNFLGCANPYYNGTTQVNVAVESGATYYIQAGDWFSGGGSLHLTVEMVPPPANDNFANAAAVASLPYTDNIDTTAATVEAGEPGLCTPPPSEKTAWYEFTPTASGSVSASVGANFAPVGVGAYTGSSLSGLTQVACGYGQRVTLHVEAGTTYHFQVGSFGQQGGPVQFNLEVPPPPVAGFFFYPSDPSIFDTLQFQDQSYDPAQAGFSSEVWNFGDGASATNCCPTHRYAADGEYSVTISVTTTDGRTATSVPQVVHVRTHDVTISKVLVPQTANVGQTRTITVGLTNSRYPETVQVQLLKSVTGAGWQQVGVLTQYVPVRAANRTTNFDFNYTFAPDDGLLGKVNFQAVAAIQGPRDAIPGDNTFISLPTKVNH